MLSASLQFNDKNNKDGIYELQGVKLDHVQKIHKNTFRVLPSVEEILPLLFL